MTQLLALVLAVKAMVDANNINHDAVNTLLNSIAILLMSFLGLLHAV